MAQRQRNSRFTLTVAAILLIAGTLAAAFWPRALRLDIAEVRTGPMIVTINEEGRTQVQETYIVSTPVAGELQRVTIQPGETVFKDKTIIANMRPANPSALDIRTRGQAKATIIAAQAALRLSRADLIAAIANRDYAHSELDRSKRLIERAVVSQVALERAEQAKRVADAAVDTAKAAIAMREAEVTSAQAQLIGFDDLGVATALSLKNGVSPDIPIRAPIDGIILQLIHKNKTSLSSGQPILEIGNIEGDMEIVVELLSSDAVQVDVGDRVIVTNWGGAADLSGTVIRTDPYGFTKHSALGVEEQRVETIILLDRNEMNFENLGHGFRVEVRIIIWDKKNTLIVPSSALFRRKQKWAVFKVVEGRAVTQQISVGQNNGVEAELLEGLQQGDRVVLFPSSELKDGQKIARRNAE
ncbi:MAG: HlyD family efflux transporter periplasmic adaptor subunit [Rhodobacteraceae bacterium]|nr:HlyD family efflux transporter periplasmic adaptor subunit [Paracoccaceae bacterium]